MRKSTEEKLVQHRKTNLDSQELAAVAKIESAISQGFIFYCMENNFVMIDASPFTDATGACENFLTIFDVDYFGKPAYLSQTGQLYLEAFLSKFGKTCCIGPSFRKEKVVDNRHSVAFTLLEIEIANCDLKELRKQIEGIFSYMIKFVSKNCGEELKLLGVKKEWLETFRPPYQVITYGEAIKKLGLNWGDDLKDKHEKRLIIMHGNKPLFVTHYPQEIKFFNMRVNRQNPKIVNSMDLLLPYSGEAVGAAEREENFELLKKRLEDSTMLKLMIQVMKKHPLNEGKKDRILKEEAIKKFNWYLDLVKKYPINHAGCGIGKNRITQAFLASNDIRACAAFPLNKESLM